MQISGSRIFRGAVPYAIMRAPKAANPTRVAGCVEAEGLSDSAAATRRKPATAASEDKRSPSASAHHADNGNKAATRIEGREVYGPLIIAYLFFGGTAAGALLVMAWWSLRFYRRGNHPSERMAYAFASLQKRVYPIGFMLLLVSMLCLLGDMNYLERAFLVFTRPHATPITFGAYALAVEMVLAALLSIANILQPLFFTGKVRRFLEILTVPCSILLMVYTGIYLFSIMGVPLWNTPWIIPLFFCSSLSSGISAALLVDYFADGSTLLLRAAKPLQKAHMTCIFIEALVTVAYGAAMVLTPGAEGSLTLLLSPNIAPVFLVGFTGFGMAVPFCMESYTLLRKECRTIPVSDFVCLVGGFCLRWCVIMCATH